MSKKKEKIRIIKNDSNNEDYTFVKDNIITIKMNQQIMKRSLRKKLMSEVKKRFIRRNHITKEEKF
jgi:hypothetical protein